MDLTEASDRRHDSQRHSDGVGVLAAPAPSPAERAESAMTTAASPERHVGDTPAWAGAAAGYDAWFDTPWGRYAFAVESAAIARAAGPPAGGRLLDAGCGTGRFGAALAERHALVVGIDPNPHMLALAGVRLDGCAQAVVEHLPFPDETFDLALGVTVLEFVAHPAAAVAELARVTRGGGSIVIGALNPHSPWGLANHGRLHSGEWCTARFLTRGALRALGASHGRAGLCAALYAPGAFPGLSLIGRLLETAGRAAPWWGAFQVLVIDKDRPR